LGSVNQRKGIYRMPPKNGKEIIREKRKESMGGILKNDAESRKVFSGRGFNATSLEGLKWGGKGEPWSQR